MIGTETVADVIIDDVEACALLDSGATADLMTLAYAKVSEFDKRPMTDLSDHFVNLNLVAGFRTTAASYIESITFRFWGFLHVILTELLWL